MGSFFRFNGLRAAGTILGIFLAAPAGATSMVRLSTDQLIDGADAVVRGTVTEIWTERDDRGAVWTHAAVEVSEVLKGDADLSAVIVDQPGGTWGATTTYVAGVARFSVGEDAVFFLETLSSGHTVPVGMMQGKFSVQLDPFSRSEIVHRFAPPARQPYDARFIPLPAVGERVTLRDFEDQIRTHLEEGWNGEPIPGASNERLRRINRLAAGVK